LSLYALRDARDQALINLARTGVLQPQTRVWAEQLDGPDDAGICASELPNGLGDRLFSPIWFSQVEEHDDDHPVPSLIGPSIDAADTASISIDFGSGWAPPHPSLREFRLIDFGSGWAPPLALRRVCATLMDASPRRIQPGEREVFWTEEAAASLREFRLSLREAQNLVISENWHANTQPRCPASLRVSECRAQVRVQQQAKTHQFRNMSRMRPQRARY